MDSVQQKTVWVVSLAVFTYSRQFCFKYVHENGQNVHEKQEKHQHVKENNLWKKIYVGASTVEWPNHGLKSFIYTCSNWFWMNFGCTFFLELIPLQRAVIEAWREVDQ